ncbi:hypothetical protein [Pseudomonas fluorescens]|uniref:hypothetical protein n=1 Tax=Pseudomonas fluorescens TaxID=294 RepID=UPI001BEB7379|nr:hypothetical protein [Pseudomonas fluorescens]MBT2375513.1 hypothetical protein [Pseudomonas fluorescens]
MDKILDYLGLRLRVGVSGLASSLANQKQPAAKGPRTMISTAWEATVVQYLKGWLPTVYMCRGPHLLVVVVTPASKSVATSTHSKITTNTSKQPTPRVNHAPMRELSIRYILIDVAKPDIDPKIQVTAGVPHLTALNPHGPLA